MRILFAGDEHHYSAYAFNRVLGLAMNTWADVTLLAICPNSPGKESGLAAPWSAEHPQCAALSRYRDELLSHWKGEESPYAVHTWNYEWVPLKNGLWEELKVGRGSKKDLRIRLRAGPAAHEIVAEATEGGADLIVLGCSNGPSCGWNGATNIPQRVVNNAICSVLLVKEDVPTGIILACIDETRVSQASLEMINQMVTMHDAQLDLIGLTKAGGVTSKTYSRLLEVSDYFGARHVKVRTQLTEIDHFENFITNESKEELLALWMGKKSLLDRFFPRDWVGRFVTRCRNSVLVLR